MKRVTLALTFLLLCLTGLATGLSAQDETPAAAPGGGGRGGRGAAQNRGPQPFDTVIKPEAKKQDGVFAVYEQKDAAGADHFYFAVPTSEMGKDFLWVSTIAQLPMGDGYGGDSAGDHVVRWEKHDNTMLLRSVNYGMVADPSLPIASAVHASNLEPIVMTFPIEAFGRSQEAVIDVTRLYSTDIAEFSPRTAVGAGGGGRGGMDASRSFIEGVHAFPTNIEVEATETFNTEAAAGAGAEATPAAGRGARRGGPSSTVLMHYSLVKLPEQPMMPRFFDERVGYFTVRQQDYGVDEHRAPTRTYIVRWRLEKKDPTAALSEPVKPIVYYVDPATPMKWRPWVRKAIEDWQPAFEQAGFKNAIIAKDPPTKEQDPTWSAADVRNSIIRWLPSTTENSVGPNIHDPRTGEVLNADVEIYQNVLNLTENWYFTQVGPLDPRARTLPLPDDLEGRLIEYVVAHEVGHTLGFQHNMKSSSLYDIAQIRDSNWVKVNGHVATLMDYSRFNYVAQPEDKIAVEDLVPKIGPYDKWATHWGYAVIPGAKTPDDEKATLNKWSSEQDTVKYLRFSTDHANGTDPGENTEAVGDADAVTATALGMKNLHRALDMLVPATTAKPGEDYARTSELYSIILGQWVTEMNHVAVIVGSVDSQNKHNDQKGTVFVPTSRARQVAAVQFLNANAFATPAWLVRPSITRLFEPLGSMELLRTSQMRVLNQLLLDTRLQHLIEIQAEEGARAYAPVDFIADVRGGVWGELLQPTVTIDPYRRNLQDGYIQDFADKLSERTAGMEEVRALLRADLKTLSASIKAAEPKAADAATRAHLDAVDDQIAKALDPKFEPAAPAAAGRGGARGGLSATYHNVGTEEWPDFRVTLDDAGGGN